MLGYLTALVATVIWASAATPQQAPDDELRLTVEPVKQDNILYEPVVIRVILENTGNQAVLVSNIWQGNPGIQVWDSGALQILYASVPGKGDEQAPLTPDDEEFQRLTPHYTPHYQGGGLRLLAPQKQLIHFHPLVWDKRQPSHPSGLPSARYMMPTPGIFWVKARFRHHSPPLESEPVPIRFHPVPEQEEPAAAVWGHPSFGGLLQYGSDPTKERHSEEETSTKLRDFVHRFPDSVYVPYARAMLESNMEPMQWAQAYYQQARPETPPIQLTLHVPKRRYLFAEPFLVAAEVKNVSDKPVRIDPRLEHVHGWMKLFIITDDELKRWRWLEGLEPGFPLTKPGEPVHAEPKDWHPITLAPGESRRKVLFFPGITRGTERSWLLWGEYRGGPGGLVESETREIEMIGNCVAGQLGGGIELAREAVFEGIPKHEIAPLILWLSESNVTRFLETGAPRDIPDRPSGRAILEELVQKYPTSLYAFYAKAALAHPKDWAERLMNDPETQWPEVRSARNRARLWLFLGSGCVLLLLAAVLVTRHRRRQAAAAASTPTETSSAVSSG